MKKTQLLNGFNLIELMITLVIIGILAGIAVPLYTDHVISTRRVEAEIALLQAAGRLEQYFSASGSYAGASMTVLGLPSQTEHGFYQLEISQATTSGYQLRAAPQGGQHADKDCGALTLDQTGQRGHTGTANQNSGWCW